MPQHPQTILRLLTVHASIGFPQERNLLQARLPENKTCSTISTNLAFDFLLLDKARMNVNFIPLLTDKFHLIFSCVIDPDRAYGTGSALTRGHCRLSVRSILPM